jgi:cholinesterase
LGRKVCFFFPYFECNFTNFSSAGGSSVDLHLLAYGGRDDKLFRGVIAESLWLGTNVYNTTSHEAGYKNFTALVGCTGSNTLACLRGKSVKTLNDAINSTMKTSPSTPFLPVIDNDFIQDIDTNQLNAGKFVHVPLLIGTNTDEGTSFSPGGINTTAQFIAQIKSTGADDNTTAIIEELYPDIPAIGIPNTYQGRPFPALGLQWKRSCAFFGDLVIHGVRRQRNEAWSNNGVKSYSYRFNVIPNGSKWFSVQR